MPAILYRPLIRTQGASPIRHCGCGEPPGLGRIGRMRGPGRYGHIPILVGLLALAGGIGAYLIATTVMISRDGVLLIEQARRLAAGSAGGREYIHVGYSWLIVRFRWLFGYLAGESGVFGWLHAAQTVSLASRVLSLVPIYLIGKRFVGRRRSLLGVAILIVLPKPAEFGADVLSDWPAMLPAVTGLWLLILAAETDRPWVYALTGLTCGLGCLVREETLQLVVYGCGWLAWQIVAGTKGVARGKQVVSLVVLVAAALLPVGAYFFSCGALPMPRSTELLERLSAGRSPDRAGGRPAAPVKASVLGAEKGEFLDAAHQIAQKVERNLHEVFAPFWLIGVIYYLWKRRPRPAWVMIACYMSGTVVLLMVRYFHFRHVLSTRYALPLVAGSICFAVTGLRLVGMWTERLVRRKWPQKSQAMRKRIRLRTVLLVAAVAVCLPRLFEPVGADREHYRLAADWLAENSPPGSRIAIMGSGLSRIGLYADRSIPVRRLSAGSAKAWAEAKGCEYLILVFKEGESYDTGPAWTAVPNEKGWTGGRDRVLIYELDRTKLPVRKKRKKRRRAAPKKAVTAPARLPAGPR